MIESGVKMNVDEDVSVDNPFPGLRPFETDEYHLFFGRDGQSDELLSRLGRTRFLAVVGTSGSGKSSLVRAGLLPALHGGLMAGAVGSWRVALMRPGGDPLGELARRLGAGGVLGDGVETEVRATVIETTLRRGALGLVEAVRQARLPADENLLVVVDQFEELFRFKGTGARSGDDASAFVKLLVEAAGQRELPVYVVLTMRSDFLGDCAQFIGLPEAINEGQYLIPRMTRDERHSAIAGPVAVGGAEITPPLVSRVLNDMGDNPDHLPIMQHALMRTWACWKETAGDGQPVDLEHYELVGGMARALAIHATEAMAELRDTRRQQIAETLFKALTERGADNREIRRPATLREICAVAEATESEVASVIEIFRREDRSFLMPPAGTPLEADTVIDISHESLIRNWDLLKAWVEGEADSARMYRRIADAAAFGNYLTGPPLDSALLWREEYQPNAAWAARYQPKTEEAAGFEQVMAFIEESRALHDAEIAEEERRRQQEAERERRELEQAAALAEKERRLAEAEKQHAEEQAAARERELEQARAFADRQARAAQRLRRFTFALILISLLALGAAGASVYAFAQANAEKQQADDAKQRAEGLATELKQSFEGERAAKKDADERRAAAEMAEDAAEKAQKHAEEEEARAEEESLRAKRAEQQAKEEEAKAETLLNKTQLLLRAQEANGLFRDATILAERGDFEQAAKNFKETIKGLENTGGNAAEGVADTYVQLGQIRFSLMQGTDMRYGRNWPNANQGVEDYDKAAELYAGEARSPDQAAEALVSVSDTLMKIAKDESVGRRVGGDGGEFAALIGKPMFSRGGGVLSFDKDFDPKVKLKNKALERYKSAFKLYRRAGNVDGMKKAAYRIGNFYLRDELTVEQDTTPPLGVGACDEVALRIVTINDRKALCYFKELERLSLAQGKDDADIYRLLVIVGALAFEAEEGSEEAEAYFKRARQAYLSTTQPGPARTGDAWSDAAEVSKAAGLHSAALSLYEWALHDYLSAQNYSEAARMFYEQGDTLLKHGDKDEPGITRTVRKNFKNAVNIYQLNLWNGNVLDGYAWSEEFFAIGSFAEENGDYDLASDAYRVALQLGEARQDLKMQARALSETGQILIHLRPGEARQSYMRAFALYSQLRDKAAKRGDIDDEAIKNMERISAIVLNNDLRRRSENPPTESFCPYPLTVYARSLPTSSIVTFAAAPSYAPSYADPPSKLKFTWTLNPPTARILSGDKDGQTIRVDTEGLGSQRLTATLVVDVVDDGSSVAACRQTAQASTSIAAPRPARE